MNQHDYSGKTVFVGMDVHKHKYVVTSMCEGVIAKRFTAIAEPAVLVDSLRRFFVGAELKSAYEAGFSGFGLHRFLVSQGVDNIVVNPASIEVSARDKVKTDKRDSVKVAVQLSAGRLTGIQIPEESQEHKRVLTRVRLGLVKERGRLGNQIKSKLFQFGLIPAGDQRIMSGGWVKELREDRTLPQDLQIGIQCLANTWKYIDGQIKALDKRLAKQAKSEPNIEAMYRSAPGIGPVSARVLANELGDMSQFANERGLFSFTGLTPSEHSSGDSRRQGHISRQGRSVLRKILVEAAWSGTKSDPALQAVFERIASHAGSKRAIVAVARKLIGRIRACFKAGEHYRLNHSK